MVLMSRGSRALVAVSTAVVTVGGLAVAIPVGAAAAASCQAAGGTGLTTLVVATPGASVNGTIDATGCDIGVYIAPGTNGVTIQDATITGANDHAIFAHGASGL